MSQLFRCDRCKDAFEANVFAGAPKLQHLPVHIVGLDAIDRSPDLCDDCRRSFKRWCDEPEPRLGRP